MDPRQWGPLSPWSANTPVSIWTDKQLAQRGLGGVKKELAPGSRAVNWLLTDGSCLDDRWCDFLGENAFLVGLALDGPRELHDAGWVESQSSAGFDAAFRALELLRQHGIEPTFLTTVHAHNGDRALAVYRFLRDFAHARRIQFAPLVEQRPNPDGINRVRPRSVRPEQFGEFLFTVFAEWVRRDVGRIQIENFDRALERWLGGGPMPDPLPGYCRRCEVRFACNGGRREDRFATTPEGEPGLNYLCQGYRLFFTDIEPAMTRMVNLLRQGRPAAEVMFAFADDPDPCPCRSGLPFGRCHSESRDADPFGPADPAR
jgi:uncharacterized protein